MAEREDYRVGVLTRLGVANADSGVSVLEFNASNHYTLARGATIPSGVAKYAVGCLFVDTSTGELYVNTGSATSCTFQAVGDLTTKATDGLRSVKVARATFAWDDAWADGVAFGLGVTLPDNAIITRAYYDVLTTFAGDGDDTSTISLLLPTDGDLVADTAIKTAGDAWDAGLHECIQDGTAANMKKLTAARELQALVTIAATDTALTAGELVLFVEYVVSG
jgi:hypothetical protein